MAPPVAPQAIKVRHDETFSRNGDDLLATIEVGMVDAILGTRTTLKALDGDVEVDIKPGTQSAEVITIKDRGVTHLRGNGRGDLRIGVQVVTPTKLNGKEQDLIKQLAGARKQTPPHFAHFQQGLFTKLRDRFMGL